MASQFLQRPQVDAGAPSQRQVGMPQGVEVGEQRAVCALDRIRDTGGFQVAPQHLRPTSFLRPRTAPDG
ncbi:MAG TPA: hypothetical protein VN688_04575 [Gemmataceae bacterium]|nr:hypothetical protein [Gemmataceae bacterium]